MGIRESPTAGAERITGVPGIRSVGEGLPGGASREFEKPAAACKIAGRISQKRDEQALDAKANRDLIDVYLPIDDGATVEIITRETDEALELIRHDAAHVMAEAVQELFPDTQVTIGPPLPKGSH